MSYYWYPYAPPPPQAQPPPRGLALAGGIIGIVASSMYLLGAGFVMVVGAMFAKLFDGWDSMGTMFAVGGSFTLGAVLGIVAGAFSCALRATWLMLSASLHVLFAGVFLYWAYGTGRPAPGLLVCVLLSGTCAALSFAGYSQAKRYQEWRIGQRRVG